MRVLWTEAAQFDLDEIERYIGEDNPAAAVETVLRVIDAVERNLAAHPGIGRPGRVHDTREFVVSGTPFIVPYQVSGQDVVVLRVLHGAMKWPSRF